MFLWAFVNERSETSRINQKGPDKSDFMRPVQPDDKLAAIVGAQPLRRSELTKKLWNYIKQHGLQDQENRATINADEKLLPIFDGKKAVTMDEMVKYVSKHLR
jgi:chromatin remodeling complex protein RSC6